MTISTYEAMLGEAMEVEHFDYQQLALRTKSNRFPLDDGRCNQDLVKLNDLLHAGLGLATEAGEFLDPIKKALFYGKEIDHVNLREELGDLLWYIAIACDALGTTIDYEMRRNIAKLKTRFPHKFTDENANNRDLAAERQVLEGRTHKVEVENSKVVTHETYAPDERRPPKE